MPLTYCALCGLTHKTEDLETCARNRVDQESKGQASRLSRRSTAATAAKMAKSSLKEESVLKTSDDEPETLDEEQCIRAEIEEMEKETRMLELVKKRDHLRRVREARCASRMGSHTEEAEEPNAPQVTTSHKTAIGTGHSSYGMTRSRRRSRDKHRRRSSSD